MKGPREFYFLESPIQLKLKVKRKISLSFKKLKNKATSTTLPDSKFTTLTIENKTLPLPQ